MNRNTKLKFKSTMSYLDKCVIKTDLKLRKTKT